MATSKKVSVVIPTYNRSILVRYTLESLLKQNTNKNVFEVIVVDDGSTDDTVQVVRSFDKLLDVKYIFQPDLGYRPGSARNKGINASQSEVILFVDSGVILDNECVNEHIRFHQQNGPKAAAIGYVYGLDIDERWEGLVRSCICPSEPQQSIARLISYSIFDRREPHYTKYNDAIEDLPTSWFYFWTCHVSVSRENLIQIGGFDKNYDGRWGVEDNDVGYRLQQEGVKLHLLRSAQAIHFPHGKKRKNVQAEGYINCQYFYRKFPSIYIGCFLEHFLETGELPDLNCLVNISDLTTAKIV